MTKTKLLRAALAGTALTLMAGMINARCSFSGSAHSGWGEALGRGVTG